MPYEKTPSGRLTISMNEVKNSEDTYDTIIEFFQSGPLRGEVSLQRETELYEDKKAQKHLHLKSEDKVEVLTILRNDTFSTQDEFTKKFNL